MGAEISQDRADLEHSRELAKVRTPYAFVVLQRAWTECQEFLLLVLPTRSSFFPWRPFGGIRARGARDFSHRFMACHTYFRHAFVFGVGCLVLTDFFKKIVTSTCDYFCAQRTRSGFEHFRRGHADYPSRGPRSRWYSTVSTINGFP